MNKEDSNFLNGCNKYLLMLYMPDYYMHVYALLNYCIYDKCTPTINDFIKLSAYLILDKCTINDCNKSSAYLILV